MKNIRLLSLLLVVVILSACGGGVPSATVPPVDNATSVITDAITTEATTRNIETTTENIISLDSIPEYSGSPYIILNNNKPEFTESEITSRAFERYSELDSLGRCGVAFACLGLETMPQEERGEIGMIKPSGWHLKKYDCVDGKYLYNRCHLIGFQLSGENANDRNLITGTRYLNIEGMLPFENMVDDYIEKTNNHVIYRVTPIFEGDNLLCKGVKMEAHSVEDGGKGISFNVFCYNAQPSIKINYKTGESYLMATTTAGTTNKSEDNKDATYILNTNSKKFHYPSCSSVNNMSSKNRKEYTGSRKNLSENGYSPCKICNP